MRTLKWLGVALYAAVLVLAPFTHHDIACHLKNPQHCTACSSNPASTDPSAAAPPDAVPLVDLGRAVLSYSPAQGVVLAVDRTGRSPPSSL